ncbi:MAG: CHAT domain-containing protein [Saprospiraceae bacterium]|nr:CHAT domain-containing protein [Saprospiraceae bacterium]
MANNPNQGDQNQSPSPENILSSNNPKFEKIGIIGVQDTQSNVPIIGEYKAIGTFKSIQTRGEGKKVELLDANLIGQAVMEDDSIWIGYLGDLDEVFSSEIKRSDVGEYKVLTDGVSISDDRGVFKYIKRKLLHVFEADATSKTAAYIAEKVDKRVMANPGLFVIDKDMNMTKYDSMTEVSGKILLLLHGTLSSTEGSFGDLKNGDLWKSIHSRYDYVLALQHYTISVSPITNVIDILKALPSNATIDILSQSRGGLIGDLLCRCDSRNRIKGFSLPEMESLSQDAPEFNNLVKEMNQLAELKRLKIGRFVRVASPSSGTSILGNRLDVYLNAILNLIGMVFGTKANPIFSAVTEFVMDVLSHRMDARSMPGLWSMVTSSTFQKLNNRNDIEVNAERYIIAGDATIGGSVGNSIMVILTNIYFWRQNDFVVDTNSMNKGLMSVDGYYFYYLSDISKTNHFNYFKNENSRKAISMAINGIPKEGDIEFKLVARDKDSRGVNLKLESKVFSCDNISGQKPIAILIPGIMGSTLADKENDLWLSILRLNKGALIDKMNIGAKGIYPTGAMDKFYSKIGNFLLKDHELKVFAFDWRLDLASAAKELASLIDKYMDYDRPIHIIAHSMGGLVMKQIMINHSQTIDNFSKGVNNKLFLLGTPWLGSHLIMEVLTGHSDRVKLLSFIDFKYTKKEIVQSVSNYPGVMQLLPMTNEGFETASFWQDKSNYANDTAVPNQQMLTLYHNYKNSTQSYKMPVELFKKVYYIAGHSKTVNGYDLQTKLFGGKKLVYKTTMLGDGSVTWELGIPSEVPTTNVYYSEISHGSLANEEVIFETIREIIQFGSSGFLPQVPPVSRGLEVEEDKKDVDIIVENDNQIIETIFDGFNESNKSKVDDSLVNVTVLNADLKYAAHPVLVGHFLHDGLYSAEKSLDTYLKQKLSERHRLGFYPGDIGASEVTYQSDSKPKGALIAGLGPVDQLTAYRLSITVEKAIIQYAFFFRDNYSRVENKNIATGISSILLGTSFAGLPVSECIRAILSGVQRANQRMVQLNSGLKTIKEIEFVDYYEDIAQQCYQILKDIESNHDSLNIAVGQFRKGLGKRRRLSLYEGAAWWHTFNTSATYVHGYSTPRGLSFSSTSGRARIEQDGIATDLKMVEYLAREFSHRSNWDVRLSKTMFELLVPNDFKSIIRNQNNMVWKMDEYSAQFPWEMFHDYTSIDNARNETPTFVNTGMIRQLLTDKYRNNPIMAEENKAFVVGDPDYTDSGFSQLSGAEREAIEVTRLLNDNKFQVTSLIRRNAQDIITDLYSEQYRVMHFAAHGLYQDEEVNGEVRKKVGIVLGKDLILEPGMINQLSYVPEFIFINCCYSIDMTGLDEKYYKGRSNLAANIGTQLIKMGVKAVVAAGWAVNDAAAHTFSTELYRKLFDGYEFGDAVLSARRKCYDNHPDNNTWGAYQCYGDHYYKLINKSITKINNTPYVTESQAIIELQNEISFITSQIVSKRDHLSKLLNIINRVRVNNLETGYIKELYAKIYAELGESEMSLKELDGLFKIEKADFSVSSLELYCSLKGKVLLDNFRETSMVNDSLLDELLADIKVLDLIGVTAERRALKALLFRRISFLRRNDVNKRSKCLLEMKEYYGEAYGIIDKTMLVDSIYILYGFFLGSYLTGSRTLLVEMNKLMKKDYTTLNAFINDIKGKLLIDKDGFRMYSRNKAIVEVYMMQLLLSETKEELDLAYNDVKKELVFVIENFGNLKHIFDEIENVEFVIGMLTMKKDQNKVKVLNDLKKILESYVE